MSFSMSQIQPSIANKNKCLKLFQEKNAHTKCMENRKIFPPEIYLMKSCRICKNTLTTLQDKVNIFGQSVCKISILSEDGFNEVRLSF